MSLFQSREPSPFVVTEKQLLITFREQVLLIADMRRGVGRPKHSIFGAERRQVDLDYGVTILGAIIDDIEKKNGKLEKELSHLYFAKTKRQWVGQKLSHMAHMKLTALGGNEIETLWKAIGDLITIGLNKSGQNIYITSDGATGVEMALFCNIIRARTAKQAHRGAAYIGVLEAGAKALGDRTLDVAYAQECERYRFGGGAA